MDFQKISIILLVLVFSFSCSKEKDEQGPAILIEKPYQLQSISSGDTIRIVGHITDNKKVTAVRIFLKGENGAPALATVNLQPNTSNFKLDVPYYFNDIHLETGTYHFVISATDGENTTTEYIEVFVGAIPKVRESVFIFDNVANGTSIYRLENSMNAPLFKTINGDFIGGVANSYHQQLIVSGSATGNLTAINASFSNTIWDVAPVTAPPTPCFTNLFFYDKTPFVSYFNGEIKGFNSFGNPNFIAHAVNGFYCENAFVHENYLVTEQVDVTRSNFRFGLYYLVSGASYLQFLIFEDIIGMYSYQPNEIVLISNDASNNGKLSFFNISDNGFSSPFSIGAGKIDATEEVGSGLYLIARNGGVSLVNTNNFTTQQYLSSQNATLIKYDVYTDELYVVDDDVVMIYDYSSKTLKGSYTHPNPILDVVFMYNR